MPSELGCIIVHPVEITLCFTKECKIRGGKLRQAISKLLSHAGWVVSCQKDRIGEPANVKFHATLCSSVIPVILGVPRLIVVPIQRNPYLAFLDRPELSVV
jgi:hypothetical protein